MLKHSICLAARYVVLRQRDLYHIDKNIASTEENVHLGGYIYDTHNSHTPSKVFPEIEKVESTKGQVYSNSAYRGIKKYYIHEEWFEKGHVELFASEQDKEIYMITWDDTVSYDDLEKIAKSFDRKLPEEIEKYSSK